MSKAIPLCDCPSAMKQKDKKVIWNPNASSELGVHMKEVPVTKDNTCVFCGHYANFYRERRPQLISLNQITDAEFNQDLVEYLGTWESGGDSWEDFGFGNRRKKKLALDEETA